MGKQQKALKSTHFQFMRYVLATPIGKVKNSEQNQNLQWTWPISYELSHRYTGHPENDFELPVLGLSRRWLTALARSAMQRTPVIGSGCRGMAVSNFCEFVQSTTLPTVATVRYVVA